MRVWPVSTRLAVTTMMAACWIRHAESATCSFTNAFPNSMGAHVALSDTSSGSATVTSSIVSYGSTAYFTCDDGITQYVHLYNSSDNSLMGTQFVMSGFYCQAINMLSLEPESYGSTSYNLDFPVSLPITAVSSGHVRVFLLNSAYDGVVVWKFQLSGGVWEFLANTTSFGAGGVFDLSTGSTDATMRCEDSNGREIASVTFNYASDVEMGIHLTLMGSSGRTLACLCTPALPLSICSCSWPTPQWHTCTSYAWSRCSLHISAALSLPQPLLLQTHHYLPGASSASAPSPLPAHHPATPPELLACVAGSEQLKYIRGCGSTGANCNSCSSSDGLSTTMIIMSVVIVVLGLALIAIGSYVIFIKCRAQDKGSTAQVVHPAQIAQIGMGTGTVPVVTGVAMPGATEPKEVWS